MPPLTLEALKKSFKIAARSTCDVTLTKIPLSFHLEIFDVFGLMSIGAALWSAEVPANYLNEVDKITVAKVFPHPRRC